MNEEVRNTDGIKWLAKNELLREKPVADSVCPQHMSQELAWNVPRASAVIGRRQTTSAKKKASFTLIIVKIKLKLWQDYIYKVPVMLRNNLTVLLLQSRDCSCYVNRRILARTPL